LQKPFSIENLNRKIRYLLDDIIDITPCQIDSVNDARPLSG
jgi:hypothetical protein